MDNPYEQYHQQLPERIRGWLNERGIKNEVVDHHFIGWNGRAITIPIFDYDGNFSLFKFRKDPKDTNPDTPKYWCETGGSVELYGWENIRNKRLPIVICEGELDRLVLESKGIPAVTGTGGAGTFKEEWAGPFEDIPEVFICYDADEGGMRGTEKVAKFIPQAKIIMLPEMGKDPVTGERKKDITDFFRLGKTDNDFRELMRGAKTLSEIEKETEEITIRIQREMVNFPPLSIEALADILGLTIKRDRENKIVTFLCMLSAYTENSQFNISYNAPSSTGKSYIPLEIAQLFPKEDVIKTAYASPTAFFHDKGEFIKELGGYEVNLERKILIFLDQPHTLLLQHLRPLLSHDDKIIVLKITDRKEKYGLKTKNILIKGFPSVIFCTGNLKIDEQEVTRMILLSPETIQEKLREAIKERVRKESDPDTYSAWLESDERRRLLKERIRAIKNANIRHIIIPQPKRIREQFSSKHKYLKPRHSRDVSRLMSLIKTLTLLNLWDREYKGRDIVANEEDVNEAFRMWDKISESQELGIPPYIHKIYLEVLLPAWYEKNRTADGVPEGTIEKVGLTRQEITKKYFQVYGRPLSNWQLRQEIIPMWEMSGLISQEVDPSDKRYTLTKPMFFPPENNEENDKA